MTYDPGYNERLFDHGIRSRVHLARFAWLREVALKISPSQPLRVVELGCFDGRSIEWLPWKPLVYDGFDANWEGGLDLGRERFSGEDNVNFHQCSSPLEMKLVDGVYDLGISLETMEHIPEYMVDGYLEILARSVRRAVLLTVPNEIGIPFLAKYIAKKFLYRDSKDEPYTLSEFFAAIFGQTSKIHRNEHKGFDYRKFTRQVSDKFVIQSVQGVPYGWLLPSLSFTVGIVAIPRRD